MKPNKALHSQKGLTDRFVVSLLSCITEKAPLETLLNTYIKLTDKGVDINNHRLIYFTLEKLVDLFNKKLIGSHTLVVIFSSVLNKIKAEDIKKIPHKLSWLLISGLTELCMWPDGCDIAIETLSYMRGIIAYSESGFPIHTAKEVQVFDDRIRTALGPYATTMGIKTLADQIPDWKRRSPVEEILKVWATQK